MLKFPVLAGRDQIVGFFLSTELPAIKTIQG